MENMIEFFSQYMSKDDIIIARNMSEKEFISIHNQIDFMLYMDGLFYDDISRIELIRAGSKFGVKITYK